MDQDRVLEVLVPGFSREVSSFILYLCPKARIEGNSWFCADPGNSHGEATCRCCQMCIGGDEVFDRCSEAYIFLYVADIC